jgi:hypothetical protein
LIGSRYLWKSNKKHLEYDIRMLKLQLDTTNEELLHVRQQVTSNRERRRRKRNAVLLLLLLLLRLLRLLTTRQARDKQIEGNAADNNAGGVSAGPLDRTGL